MYTRVFSRASDALSAHYFVGIGIEIVLSDPPFSSVLSLSLFPSTPPARKIVSPKWSAAVYRTTVTAYPDSKIFRRREVETHRWKYFRPGRSLRMYFSARESARLPFLSVE